MNTIGDRADINNLLAQMRDVRSRVQAPALSSPVEGVQAARSLVEQSVRAEGVGTSQAPSFGQMLVGALDAVNDTQQTASKLQEAFQRGDQGVTLTQVMIASEKSSVSFEALKQVRNRMVSAYKDVMNMPI